MALFSISAQDHNKMLSKIIATSAGYVSPRGLKHLKTLASRPRSQRGVTLIELLVGLVIGLLVVAAAMGTMMVSRGISGTVSDASNIQQQAAYAMRTIGLQLRQAGSLRLDLNPTGATEDIASAVVDFEPESGDFNYTQNIIRGIDAPTGTDFKLTTGYGNYKEALHIETDDASQARDCLGQQPSETLIENNFVLKTATNELYCGGFQTPAQPIAEKVANFQVRYLMQESTAGDPQIKYATASTVGKNWGRVQAVEVCLVLYGNESIDLPAVRKVLEKAGLTLDDIGMIELNEAFAAQSLAVIRELGLDMAKVNVSGGAIAMGHPLGATGGRILTTLVHGMKRTRTRYGIATLCMGGGQGGATLLELAD